MLSSSLSSSSSVVVVVVVVVVVEVEVEVAVVSVAVVSVAVVAYSRRYSDSSDQPMPSFGMLHFMMLHIGFGIPAAGGFFK